MRVLVIDNYDSFVYNLVLYVEELGAKPTVYRNDEITVRQAIVQNGGDAAIVGSGFVRIIEKRHDREEEMLKALEEYACQLKEATIKKPARNEG